MISSLSKCGTAFKEYLIIAGRRPREGPLRGQVGWWHGG